MIVKITPEQLLSTGHKVLYAVINTEGSCEREQEWEFQGGEFREKKWYLSGTRREKWWWDVAAFRVRLCNECELLVIAGLTVPYQALNVYQLPFKGIAVRKKFKCSLISLGLWLSYYFIEFSQKESYSKVRSFKHRTEEKLVVKKSSNKKPSISAQDNRKYIQNYHSNQQDSSPCNFKI